MIKMIFKFLKNIYVIKYTLKQLEKFIVFNYISKNFKRIGITLSNLTFLFVILFTMISLSLYLETDVETFVKENKNDDVSFSVMWDTNNRKKDEVKETNLVSWGGWDVSNNQLTKSDTEPIGSYEQVTNNDKINPINENENYELDWWRWPKSELIDGENLLNNSPCRAGTSNCNKLQNKELINHADLYTTSPAYKKAA